MPVLSSPSNNWPTATECSCGLVVGCGLSSSTHELGSAWHQCRQRVDAVGIEPTTDTRHQLNRLITLMGCRLNGAGNALPTMLRIHPVLKRTGNLDGESNYRPKARAALTPHLKPLARGPLFPAADGQTKGSRFLVGFASCCVGTQAPVRPSIPTRINIPDDSVTLYSPLWILRTFFSRRRT